MRKKKKPFVKEVSCLNCGTVLHGKFCAACGQKAFIDKDNFFHLAFEFIADYFHFDGKFFHTLKALVVSPGKITREYILGKRKTFLNPIQMYLFISAIFFIVITTLSGTKNTNESASFEELVKMRDSLEKHKKIVAENKRDLTTFSIDEFGFLINNRFYTIQDYDSVQNTLTPDMQDPYLIKKFNEKLLAINKRSLDPRDAQILYNNTIINALPKVFFLILPLFALVLFIFFHKYPYADHIIFSLHFHTIAFALFLLLAAFSYLFDLDGNIMLLFGTIAMLIYLFLSIKRAYANTWLKTSLKYVGFLLLYGFTFFSVMIAYLILVVFLV